MWEICLVLGVNLCFKDFIVKKYVKLVYRFVFFVRGFSRYNRGI